MRIFCLLGHHWEEVTGLTFSAHILFARPVGQAVMIYCERCGVVRLVGMNDPVRKKIWASGEYGETEYRIETGV